MESKMFKIEVLDIDMAKHKMRTEAPTKIVSILDSHHAFPPIGDHHIFVEMSDVNHDTDYYPALLLGTSDPIIPAMEHLKTILAHTSNMTDDDYVLVHCFAGQSRSTAAAIAICMNNGMPWKEAFHHIEEVRPIMMPNTKIIALIDDYFDLNGELIEYHIKWGFVTMGKRIDIYKENDTGAKGVDDMSRIMKIINGE
jgi:predicted protein tyrosine phosphatase